MSLGKISLVLFICLTSAFFAASCSSRAESKSSNENAQANAEKPAVVVSKAVATSREVPSFVQATGSLTADETSDVAPKVSGKVISTPVNVGAFVRQGDILVKLDDRNARLQVQELQANVRQAEAAVRQAEARLGLDAKGNFQASNIPEVRAANASYEQAQAELKQAEANEQRYRDLAQTGDTSIQNYESYRTQRDTARARVNNARQQLEAAANAARQNNQAVKSAQASVEAVRTQVATAEQAIADAVVRAPYSGFLSSRPVAIGEFVSTSTPVATILRTNPLKLQLQVPERSVPSIKQGMGVSLEVDAYRDRKFAGTVAAVNPSIDQQSRTAVIEAAVENSDNALRAGMFATARVALPGGNVSVFVPRAAVLSDPNTQSYRVFVLENNTAKLRVVQIGQEESDMIEILSGVNVNEILATSNLDQLFEGAVVQVQ